MHSTGSRTCWKDNPVPELVSDIFISLDGFALGEGFGPYFGFDGPDLQAWIAKENSVEERLLLGRKTFSELLKFGGTSDPEMTRKTKLVATRTGLDTGDWANAEALVGDVGGEVSRLKADGGSRLRSFGSLTIVRSLLAEGLVDRLRLLIFPLVLGPRGREPWFERAEPGALRLLETQTLDERLVLLVYGPEQAREER